jgi:hypothetical protein
MKRIWAFLAATLSVLTALFLINYDRIMKTDRYLHYQQGITLLESGRYIDSLEQFSLTDYQDSRAIREYAQGLILLEEGMYKEAGEIISGTRELRNSQVLIKYCDASLAFAEHESAGYDEFFGKVYFKYHRLGECEYPEYRLQAEALERKIRDHNETLKVAGKQEKYKDTIPYAGMREDDISYTAAGPYTVREEHKNWTYYRWYIGQYEVLTVRVNKTADCQQGPSHDDVIKLHDVVTEVEQHFTDIAWGGASVDIAYRIYERKLQYASMKMPRFGPSYHGEGVTEADIRRYISSHIHHGSDYSYSDDSYSYYDDFEDFYNDHGEDFDSIEEAQEFFDSYY